MKNIELAEKINEFTRSIVSATAKGEFPEDFREDVRQLTNSIMLALDGKDLADLANVLNLLETTKAYLSIAAISKPSRDKEVLDFTCQEVITNWIAIFLYMTRLNPDLDIAAILKESARRMRK